MNPAQIHLALCHLPMGFILVGVPLLLAAVLRKSKELKGAASLILLLSALTAIPVFLSGEPTEEMMGHRPGISGKVMYEHEEAAELFLIVVELLGALVLAAWLFERFKAPAPPMVWFGILAVGIVSFGLFARAAHLGGFIRHEEIGELRSEAASSEYSEDQKRDE